MSRIEKYIKEFEGYLHGDWDDHKKAAFNKRLEDDTEMQEAWKEYQAITDAISDNESVSFRLMLNNIYNSRFRQGRTQYLNSNIWFRLSAAAVVIVIVGCLLYFFCTRQVQEFATNDATIDTLIVIPEDTSSRMAKQSDLEIETNEIETHSPQIASIYEDERYQIDPAYAELLHNVYRSHWFSLSSPSDSVHFQNGDSITFSWESNIYEPIYFDVLDRAGKVVYKHKDSIESPWTYTPFLDPAIYMFRFSTKDQPIWMGVMVGR